MYGAARGGGVCALSELLSYVEFLSFRGGVYQSVVDSSSNSIKIAASTPASSCRTPSACGRNLPALLPCYCVAGGGAFPAAFSLLLYLLRRFLLL